MTWIRTHRVSELFKTVAKVREAQREPQLDVRAIALDAAAHLVGAPAGILVEDTCFVHGGRGPLKAATPLNVEALLPGVVEIIENRTSMPLFNALIQQGRAATGTIALARSDCFTRSAWQRSPFIDRFLRPVGFGDCVAAVQPRGARGHVVGFNFLRARGDRPFTAEDRALLALFTESAGELINPPSAVQQWKLTRRESAVLAGLQRGQSNKELAGHLGCSVRTIEAHVAQLLRKSNAPSRARLVFMTTRAGPAPA